MKNLDEESLKTQEKSKPSVVNEIIGNVLYLAVVVLCCLLFIRFVAVRTVVIGTSMYPTLDNRDNLVVERLSGNFRDYRRFEIIVFDKDNSEEKNYIKRVIGLPGETVQIIEGRVYINGALLESDVYGSAVMDNAYTAAEPIVLGADEYFVLGDNRNNSRDSRSSSIGPVKKSEILGRAVFRFFPFEKFGTVH